MNCSRVATVLPLVDAEVRLIASKNTEKCLVMS